MVKVWQAKPLTMCWCIDCHKGSGRVSAQSRERHEMGYDYPQINPSQAGGRRREGDETKSHRSTDELLDLSPLRSRYVRQRS